MWVGAEPGCLGKKIQKDEKILVKEDQVVWGAIMDNIKISCMSIKLVQRLYATLEGRIKSQVSGEMVALVTKFPEWMVQKGWMSGRVRRQVGRDICVYLIGRAHV